MRRKSIGATSQAFHEPMSTGAFLEFLTGMQGSEARFTGAWGPPQRLKCWSEDGNPASHGTVQLRLRKPSNAPQGQRIGGYGSNKVKNLACRKSVRVAGSRPQGPVGQVSRGLGARAPRAWGPAHQGPAAFWGCKGERKRVFTLSAFGNHPTRPPRSADPFACLHSLHGLYSGLVTPLKGPNVPVTLLEGPDIPVIP